MRSGGRFPEAIIMVSLWDSNGPNVCKLRSFSKISFFSLFPCPFVLNLLFEADGYSNEYLLAKCGVDTDENVHFKDYQRLAKSSKKSEKYIKHRHVRRYSRGGMDVLAP